jgi:propanol-preferring alcohol dehydrogenase
LLCSGIIGYRALRRAALPPGGRLGLYGFGASAHLTAQIAIAQGAEVHVLTRGEDARRLALALGAASAGDAYDAAPVPLDSAILFAPVGDLVLPALEALDQGGTLAVAGIHLSDIPALDYQRHLFAAALGIRPRATTYAFEEADRALDDLARGELVGAAVLQVS